MQEGPTVLVVDDEPIILSVMTIVLRKAGYRVLAAANGAQALALVHASGAPVYVAVLDLTMPGIGGVRLLAGLREIDSNMRALFISGFDTVTGLPAGCDFLTKPFTAAELLRAVDDAGEHAIAHSA